MKHKGEKWAISCYTLSRGSSPKYLISCRVQKKRQLLFIFPYTWKLEKIDVVDYCEDGNNIYVIVQISWLWPAPATWTPSFDWITWSPLKMRWEGWAQLCHNFAIPLGTAAHNHSWKIARLIKKGNHAVFTAKRKNRFVTSSDLNSQFLPPIVENQKFTRGCNRGCILLLSIVSDMPCAFYKVNK